MGIEVSMRLYSTETMSRDCAQAPWAHVRQWTTRFLVSERPQQRSSPLTFQVRPSDTSQGSMITITYLSRRSGLKVAGTIVLVTGLATVGLGCSNEAPPPSISDAIQDMEDSGEWPVLDRTEAVLGVDEDLDGVRDDLESVIDRFEDSDEQKRALNQYVKALSSILVVDESPDSIATAMREEEDAVLCIRSVYGSRLGRSRRSQVRNFVINTLPRIQQYERYLDAVDGTVYTSRGEGPSTCE